VDLLESLLTLPIISCYVSLCNNRKLRHVMADVDLNYWLLFTSCYECLKKDSMLTSYVLSRHGVTAHNIRLARFFGSLEASIV